MAGAWAPSKTVFCIGIYEFGCPLPWRIKYLVIFPGLATFGLKESSALSTPPSNPFLNTTSILGFLPWDASTSNMNSMGALSNWEARVRKSCLVHSSRLELEEDRILGGG